MSKDLDKPHLSGKINAERTIPNTQQKCWTLKTEKKANLKVTKMIHYVQGHPNKINGLYSDLLKQNFPMYFEYSWILKSRFVLCQK